MSGSNDKNCDDSYYEEIVIKPCYVKLTRLIVIEVGPEDDLRTEKLKTQEENTKNSEPTELAKWQRKKNFQSGRKVRNCVFCEKPLKGEITKYFRHLTSHIQERPLFCKNCDETFIYDHDFKNHFHRMHLKLSSYKCERCDKAFARSENLRRHNRVEHQGYKIQCPLCNISCKYRHDLKTHIRNIHQVESGSLDGVFKLAKVTVKTGTDGAAAKCDSQ